MRGKNYTHFESAIIEKHYNKIPIAELIELLGNVRSKGSIQAYAHKIGVCLDRSIPKTKEEKDRHYREWRKAYQKRKLAAYWQQKQQPAK